MFKIKNITKNLIINEKYKNMIKKYLVLNKYIYKL